MAIGCCASWKLQHCNPLTLYECWSQHRGIYDGGGGGGGAITKADLSILRASRLPETSLCLQWRHRPPRSGSWYFLVID